MEKFLNKLDIERTALKLVNHRFGDPQLCGLARGTINVWLSGHPECNRNICCALLSVSESVNALSERSGERFDEQYAADSAKSRDTIESLKARLSEI